jgi:hypothetical protein
LPELLHHQPSPADVAVEDVCGLLSQKRLPAPQRLALEQELARLKAVLRRTRDASAP